MQNKKQSRGIVWQPNVAVNGRDARSWVARMHITRKPDSRPDPVVALRSDFGRVNQTGCRQAGQAVIILKILFMDEVYAGSVRFK